MSRRRETKAPATPREPRVPPPLPPPLPPEVAGRSGPGPWPRGTKRRLRDELEQFAAETLGEQGTIRALDHYAEASGLSDDTLVVKGAETAGFLEWLVNDYEPYRGGRLIVRYGRERGAALRPAEREMLALWQTENHLRLLEIQAVRPGRGVTAEDLLSGETFEVEDRNASRSVLRWELALARTCTGDQRRIFTGALSCLSPRHKPALTATMNELWDQFRAAYPAGTAGDFYRRHGLDLLAVARARQAIEEAPPVLVTEEGHEAVEATADFDLADGRAAAASLRAGSDFVYGGPSPDHPRAVQFIWVRADRTVLPAAADFPDGALMLRTEIKARPGAPVLYSLGDVWVWSDRLRLRCLSRERLAVGRQLLEALLGSNLHHRQDRVEPIQPPGEPGPRRPGPRRLVGGAGQRRTEFQRQNYERHTEEWLSTPIRSLGDLSPREAVRTPEGRAKTAELLKAMDYYDELARRRGDPPPMDVARIRRELGLPAPEP